MAAYKTPSGVDKKRKSKKRKSRLEVSSSSESDSDVETQKKKERTPSPVEQETQETPKATLKKEKKKPKPTQEHDGDEIMIDALAQSNIPKATSSKIQTPAQTQEDFDAIYLRRITTELADDLDKVREAQDFKASSLPMLIHALKQGGSVFSAEEKRRIVVGGAAV
ncbi:uncharacterized protein K460DRAFT_418638 [Cucurbitaria berberidis CBS 394.84]|uniref:Ribosome assembly protein 3 n=1 Tax=Cucurbitaria berberidis CBS 394.84 TaxID=1168544 RepID=A0A9P4GDN0_9PLEO|nr:uncharacterized protein K460DRAFT_418638 [Cucurbitaria berberidis CBS 394.84]KAF1843601.1 hypothetical protein K460DRAFT_418638 [Cucurbitaria berberidis CBS 394.84]